MCISLQGHTTKEDLIESLLRSGFYLVTEEKTADAAMRCFSFFHPRLVAIEMTAALAATAVCRQLLQVVAQSECTVCLYSQDFINPTNYSTDTEAVQQLLRGRCVQLI